MLVKFRWFIIKSQTIESIIHSILHSGSKLFGLLWVEVSDQIRDDESGLSQAGNFAFTKMFLQIACASRVPERLPVLYSTGRSLAGYPRQSFYMSDSRPSQLWLSLLRDCQCTMKVDKLPLCYHLSFRIPFPCLLFMSIARIKNWFIGSSWLIFPYSSKTVKFLIRVLIHKWNGRFLNWKFERE